MPRIAMIAAMGHQRVIGIENRLPWKLPADMRWFRRHTLGKPIIMGRKTFESFGARPLPDRHNIVITHDPNYAAQGASVVTSIDQALQAAGEVEEVMVIGGASFYAQMLPMASRLYLTQVDIEVDGDAWFPDYKPADWDWVEEHHHPADEKNSHPMTFQILDRVAYA